MASRNLWTCEELIVTLALYFQLPFGRLNHGTPEVMQLAALMSSADDLIGTTCEAVVKQRVNQNVFRSMMLANYNTTCAITGITVPELLVASHIVPWAENEQERLNPENGICLSSLYDKAFDQGLISICV